MGKTAEKYITECFMIAVMVSAAVFVLLFMFFSQMKISITWAFVITPAAFVFTMFYLLNAPLIYIAQREREINKHVLFAGRYLLIKMQSGEPLFLSLIGVTKSYGETGKVFNEIVQDIHFGARIEDAIDKAIKRNPCENLRKVLWDISNSIKTGSDMTKSLSAILDGIDEEYFTEIEKYGRKINSLTLFYMVLAIIVPSLGMTMACIIASFIGLDISMTVLYAVLFFVVCIQFAFISLYQSIRPAVMV